MTDALVGIRESKVDLRDVYSLSPERYGRFDVVLFLGVIDDLRHPLLALDRIHDVCGAGTSVVESHVIDEGIVDQRGAFTDSPTSIGAALSSLTSTSPPHPRQ